MAFYFENLIVWKKSYSLVKIIHEMLPQFPLEQKFALTDQVRRSSLSIVSNVAEGSVGRSDADHKHFLLIAHGSCMELATQIMLANDFGYISLGEREKILSLVEEIVKMLFVMRNK